MELKRVVITGLGTISPIGQDVTSAWNALLQGRSGAAQITLFDASKFKTQFACEVKNFDASLYLDRKEQRKHDRFSQFALVAARQAMADSTLCLQDEDTSLIGVILGCGMGGLNTFQKEISDYAVSDGTPRYNPFLIPKVIPNLAAGHISIEYGLRGVNMVTTSACASSSHAIATAFDQIRLGRAIAVLTGGAEAPIVECSVGGFNAMHALSTQNDAPETASRPFSLSRSGFVLGEGATCLVLEELQHALQRHANIYAEIVGAGYSADAYHITAPDPEGQGASLVMQNALNDAHITPQQVGYINAHGTSTPLGDLAEAKAIYELWQHKTDALNVSSTKSMTGHMLGAAGAFEALATILALRDGIVPPTINHKDDDDPSLPPLNYTFNTPEQKDLQYAMSNSFGFGGHNASLIFKKWLS